MTIELLPKFLQKSFGGLARIFETSVVKLKRFLPMALQAELYKDIANNLKYWNTGVIQKVRTFFSFGDVFICLSKVLSWDSIWFFFKIYRINSSRSFFLHEIENRVFISTCKCFLENPFRNSSRRSWMKFSRIRNHFKMCFRSAKTSIGFLVGTFLSQVVTSVATKGSHAEGALVWFLFGLWWFQNGNFLKSSIEYQRTCYVVYEYKKYNLAK